MKTRIILSIILASLGLIIAATPKSTTHNNQPNSQQLLQEVAEGGQYITTDEIAQRIIEKDPTLQLIDVRNQEEFEKFALPGAINIPMVDLLAAQYTDILDQEAKVNVFYSNGSLDALEAWMITRQLGSANNFVLKGGLNYWVETIVNPTKPDATSPDEELAKYNFRIAAGKALGGGTDSTISTASTAPTKPATSIKPVAGKKKKAAGGC